MHESRIHISYWYTLSPTKIVVYRADVKPAVGFRLAGGTRACNYYAWRWAIILVVHVLLQACTLPPSSCKYETPAQIVPHHTRGYSTFEVVYSDNYTCGLSAASKAVTRCVGMAFYSSHTVRLWLCCPRVRRIAYCTVPRGLPLPQKLGLLGGRS